MPVPIIDSRLLSQMQIGNWDTDAGGLDVPSEIRAAPGSVGYAHQRQNAAQVTVQRRMLLVASLADITAPPNRSPRVPKTAKRSPSCNDSWTTPLRGRATPSITDDANARRPETRPGAESVSTSAVRCAARWGARLTLEKRLALPDPQLTLPALGMLPSPDAALGPKALIGPAERHRLLRVDRLLTGWLQANGLAEGSDTTPPS